MNGKATYTTKTVFISGAAGGLGSAAVKKFADLGYRVFAADIDTTGLSKFNILDNVKIIELDITNYEKVGTIVRNLDLDEQGLDILVCLAGIYHTYPVTEADSELFRKIMAVNLFGTAALVQGFLHPLIKNKGRVIVVSSESYKIQAMFQPYMISKAALEAWCRVARQELSLKDVKLTIIRPGAIRTPLLKWMDSPVEAGKYPVFQKAFTKSWINSVKMVGKVTTPEKVAGRIIKASTVSEPKRIYRINNNLLLTIVSFVPAWILDRLIVRIFKKKG
jgi:NAD(P)-dependent dehydrogenase (short-subunit alcohol dehydrogenase family)